MPKYVNLFLKTCYSIFESSIRIDDLIQFAKKNQITTLAIADTNVMFGAMEFYFACKKNGIKPIIGLDAKVEDGHFLLYAKNFEGYKKLVDITSKLNTKINVLLNDEDTTNLVVIEHPENIVNLKQKNIIRKQDVYLEKTTYLEAKESNVISLLEFIKTNLKNKNAENSSFFNLNPLVNEELIKKSNEIAQICNLEIPLVKFEMPNIYSQNNILPSAQLRKLCLQALSEKEFLNDHTYINRLNYELEVIIEMNFESYFLAIFDFITWAKDQKIIVGPGRGSAPSSLVCFLLKITEIDPIKNNLYFERFLNKERISFPDIDLDIEDSRREEVISYIFEKYPKNCVAQIITFQKFGAKMAMRDTLKFLGVELYEIDSLAKVISPYATLTELWDQSSRFKAAIRSREDFKKAFELAKQLEGLPRQVGTHAAGLIISKKEIHKLVPTIEINGRIHTQYSMNYLEHNGLVKIDILGLKNLSIIRKIQDSIFISFHNRVQIEKINTNNPRVNKLFSDGLTNGIFQFESSGMKRTLREVKVDNFNDLVAINALFRPGPMENISIYAQRKQSQNTQPVFQSTILNDLLKETFWIPVYQEQIMQIVQIFAGLSYGKADIMRRAISKKDDALMETLRNEFFEGAKKLGRLSSETNEVFELIAKFASYGFNKSHATAYSLIAYWMAYFKVQFPTHFFVALMDLNYASPIHLNNYFNEARQMNIEFTGAHVNLSEEDFCINENKIIFPLKVVKNIGQTIYSKILFERRERGKFTSFFNFVARAKVNSIPESVIEILIKAGALNLFSSPSQLMLNLKSAIRYAEMVKISKGEENKIDFSIIEEPIMKEAIQDFFQESIWEKESTSLLINSHPCKQFEKLELSFLSKVVQEQNLKKLIKVCVLIENIKTIKTKAGKDMAFISISDQSLEIEIVAFDWELKSFGEKLKKNTIVICELELQKEKSPVLKNFLEVKAKYE